MNSPHNRQPIIPKDPQVVGGLHLPTPTIQTKDGLYNRDDVELNIAEVTVRLQDGSAGATIQDYQYWGELAWKTEHGTYDSVERFSSKLAEEQEEVLSALSVAERASPLYVPKEDINLELGDALWCMAALTSNGGGDIDAGMKRLLFRYVCGTSWVVGGVPQAPPWREKAGELATKYEPITFKEVDELLEAGFEPSASPVMNVLDPRGDEEDVSDHQINWGMIILSAQVMARRQYGREEGNSEGFVLEGKYEELAHELGELAASAFFEAAFIGSRATGASLSEIIGLNVKKLTGRVEQNQIDKTDRSPL